MTQNIRFTRFSLNIRIAIGLSRFFLLPVLAVPLHAQRPDHIPMRKCQLDVQHQVLDLSLDLAQKRASGTAVIRLAPLQTTNSINLDAAFLQIRKVRLYDGPALPYSYDGGDADNNLHITLPRPCKAGEPVTLQIEYHTLYHNDSDPNNLWGSYGKGLRFFAPTTTEPRKRKQIWSMGEPNGNRYWFPGQDSPGDLRTCELWITVEKPLQAIAVGQLRKVVENPDNTRTFHWKSDIPHANHQTAFVIGEYEKISQEAAGIQLCSYSYPDEIAATQATVERLPDMLRFFTDLTRRELPYSTYNQVFVQDFPWGGGSHPGFSTISENMVDDYGTHADFFYLWDGVEAQDLAAQWFGHLLTPADWSDVWLTKSLALYLDAMYSEYKNGHDEMQLWNRQYQLNTCMADWNVGLRRPLVTHRSTNPADLCFDNNALRGALVLHLLRLELGEKTWRKVLRTYARAYAGKTVTTADFQQVVEKVSGQSYYWFFDQWVYKMGQPEVEVQTEYNKQNRQLTLIIKQIQKPDSLSEYPQVRFFQGKMMVDLGGKMEAIQLKPLQENRFQFSLEAEPKWINVNAGSAWPGRFQLRQNLDAWLNQCLNATDVMARRSALLELAGYYRNEQTGSADKSRILDAFRTVVTGPAYWRLRYTALLSWQGLVAGQALNPDTETMLLDIIRKENSWMRAAAISFLGDSGNPAHAELYIRHFQDSSDRVVNAAANALGKSKSEKALAALIRLPAKPSWKNQSLISALNGLRALGDPGGAALAMEALKDSAAAPRWTLATPVWDFRLAAAETLAALGKGHEAYPLVHRRFLAAMQENDVNDIFGNVLLMVALADPRAQEVLPTLRERFKHDANAMQAVEGFAAQINDLNKTP